MPVVMPVTDAGGGPACTLIVSSFCAPCHIRFRRRERCGDE
jgi:hypothetical protein